MRIFRQWCRERVLAMGAVAFVAFVIATIIEFALYGLASLVSMWMHQPLILASAILPIHGFAWIVFFVLAFTGRAIARYFWPTLR